MDRIVREPGCSRTRVQYTGTLLLLLAAACGTASGNGQTAVRTGVDVLAESGPGRLAGLRVGLITNHTGVAADGRSTIDVLASLDGVQLVALFAPEHGIRGAAEAGERIQSGIDSITGLPIISLYDDTRTPTAEELADIDALVFDIQEIGTRYYTYQWLMTLAMQAAAEQGKVFVVLDRPNPIDGVHVQGNVQEEAHLTYVGLHPVPMRHGLTVGELARWANRTRGIGADLTVVPMEGWQRDMLFDDTRLAWRPPSPNMPTLESALHYPGTCLFEGTNLSVGRGTAAAFQHIGAPWLNADSVVAALNARSLPGTRFEAVTFTPQSPGDNKYGGEVVQGIRFVATDRDAYDPTIAAVAALVEIRRMHPDSLTFREAHFDRLAGTTRLREGILAGDDVNVLTADWAAQRAAFEASRQEALLYRD